MTPRDNSLEKYNYGLTNTGQPANNFNRPNVTNFRPESGRLYEIQYENIMTSTPKVNWNSYNTKDPILNFGSTSSNIGGSNFIETLGTVATGLSLFGGIAMTGVSLASAIKSMKGNSNNVGNQQVADENLNSLTESANNYDKKSDPNAMLNTANNLTTAINTSKQKLNNAKRTVNTAETTITNLNKSKTEYESKLADFITNKDALETNVKTDENSLADLKALPEDQRPADYDQQVSTLENRIQENKRKLETEYSDAKQKQIEDQISRINDEIAKWTETKLENEIIVKQLPDEIKNAEKAKESLNKKIEKYAQ